MAHVLGYPTCETERFVTDPEFGTLLPNASYVVPKANLTPPMEQYTNMYPFHALPHYESLNSGRSLCTDFLPTCMFELDDPNLSFSLHLTTFSVLLSQGISEMHVHVSTGVISQVVLALTSSCAEGQVGSVLCMHWYLQMPDAVVSFPRSEYHC